MSSEQRQDTMVLYLDDSVANQWYAELTGVSPDEVPERVFAEIEYTVEGIDRGYDMEIKNVVVGLTNVGGHDKALFDYELPMYLFAQVHEELDNSHRLIASS